MFAMVHRSRISGGFGGAPAGNAAFGAPAPAFGSTGGLFGAPAAPASTGFSFGGNALHLSTPLSNDGARYREPHQLA